MTRNRDDESAAESAARDAAAKLDEATEKIGGTSNVDSGVEVGYTEDDSDERLQGVADEIGVTLHRNPDGSHTAVEESQSGLD